MERLEDAGRHVVHELERFINTLGTIAGVAPLLGLLGTVGGIIKSFNAINSGPLERDAFRKPERLGIPLASNDAEAMKIAAQLVSDAGFDPQANAAEDRPNKAEQC